MLTVFGVLFAFLLGAAIGSFVNVLVVRLGENVSILGRSRCLHCRRTLMPRHLVPILSWMLLKGKCAFCQKRIHWQYPAVEAMAGVLAAVAYVRHPFFLSPDQWSAFLFETLFAADLLALSAFDLRWQLLPIEYIVGSGVVFTVWHALLSGASFASLATGFAFGVAFLGVQVLVSRGRWLGSGDPWLGGMLGAVLGWPDIGVSFYFSYLIGGAVALALVFSGWVKRGSHIAFAPFLCIGAWLALWFGPLVQAWLASRF